jgi:phosphomannomutase
MAAKFGTSGLRGLVGDLTDGTAAAHARAFARHLKQTGMTGEGGTATSAATGGPRARTSRHNAPRHCLRKVSSRSIAVSCRPLPWRCTPWVRTLGR